MLCLCGFSGPHLSKEEITQERAQREGEKKKGGRGKEATERGTEPSHCSIKSVGNDQDEMMAIFLL